MSSPTRSVNDHRVTRDIELLSTLAYLDRMSTDRIERVLDAHLSDEDRHSLVSRYAAKARNLRLGFTKFREFLGPATITEAIAYDAGTCSRCSTTAPASSDGVH